MKVACVEGRGSLGGTCLNVGCIPSKALLNASHAFAEARDHMGSVGVKFEGLSYDWAAMQKAKDETVSGLTKGIEGLFKKNKVRRRRARVCVCARGWGRGGELGSAVRS